MKRRPNFPALLVLAVAFRDGYRCHVCGDGYDPADPWQIDHDVAVARGGRHSLKNLRLAHASCNRDKGAA